MDINPILYARSMGIDPYREYKPSEAAKLIRVGISQIRKAKNDEELQVIMTGERNYTVLGLDLIQWKLNKRTQSATTISPRIDRELGVERGMTAKNKIMLLSGA